jgi:hypothetical protein
LALLILAVIRQRIQGEVEGRLEVLAATTIPHHKLCKGGAAKVADKMIFRSKLSEPTTGAKRHADAMI